MYAGTKIVLRATQGIQGVEQMQPERIDAVRATVGQRVLCLGPDALVGVEFRSIGRKGFETQAGVLTKKGADRLTFVDSAVVPDDDDVSAQVAQEMTQEAADFFAMDVLLMHVEEKPDSFALGADR